jgi:hypothetical protein
MNRKAHKEDGSDPNGDYDESANNPIAKFLHLSRSGLFIRPTLLRDFFPRINQCNDIFHAPKPI